VLTKLRDSNVLSDDIVEALDSAVDTFKQEFQTGEGKPLASVGTEEFEATQPEEISQEQIVRGKR
jgi:F-type H+-transporting ATPase subunit alpha